MAEERVQRKLAAILAADVVGYSRLIEADEEGTRARLRSLQAELIDPRIAADGGRIVKTMGDGILVEFPSAVDAVRNALAIQSSMVGWNTELPEDQRLVFRVGINLGDVIIEGEDIHGDGVNVAARLEGLCEPGSVYVSSTVHEHVEGKLSAIFDDLGEQRVKNIAKPVRVYVARSVSEDTAKFADTTKPLLLPDKPSIAVLPFDNLSGNLDQEPFANGMTEDLITDLSKVSGLFVVARNSSFAFKDKSEDIRTVAAELGVRYVLEGSVRKSGSQVRINAQLIDATTGGHLWADRYDGSVENVFELQDEVSANVVAALSVELKVGEKERLERVHTHNLDAYELFVRAKTTAYPPVKERFDTSREMFERVIEMDPHFAGGYAGVASMLAFEMFFGHTNDKKTIDRAMKLARKGIELDETFAWSYTALAYLLMLSGEIVAAVNAAEEAISHQPNDADAHAYRGIVLAYAGRTDDALASINQALRLNPQYPTGPYLNQRAHIHILAGNYEDAVESLEQNLGQHGPYGPPAKISAVASYAALGRTTDARRAVQRLKDEHPSFHLSTYTSLAIIPSDDVRNHLLGLLHEAGVPE